MCRVVSFYIHLYVTSPIKAVYFLFDYQPARSRTFHGDWRGHVRYWRQPLMRVHTESQQRHYGTSMHKQRSTVMRERWHQLRHTLTGRPGGGMCACLSAAGPWRPGQNVAKWIWFIVRENCRRGQKIVKALQQMSWSDRVTARGSVPWRRRSQTHRVAEARHRSRRCKEEEMKVAAEMCRPEWDFCPRMSFGIFAFQRYYPPQKSNITPFQF